MRTTTAPELTTLAATTRIVTPRIKVANGSGTMIDLTSWMSSASIEHDVDQPVGGATISFVRAHGATQSLSPLRTDSTLNVNDVPTYSPLLDLNRSVTIEIATTDPGATIVAGDYKMLFKGTIDVVNFEKNPVTVECRDLGAPLVDRWIETEATFGSGGGTAIQTVMQNIIDSVFGAAVYTLYVPVSPGFNIVAYKQQKMSVMDALQDLVQIIGWDVRFKWDSGTSTFRLTLTEPDRTKTVPDHTFGPSQYIDITRLNLDLTNIRNVVTVSYRNSANFGNRAVVTASDAPSITKYGRRFFFIQEADISPIDTSAEATTMAEAARDDLKEPKADQEVHMPFFWPVDLGDLYRYSDNDVHYDTNQDLSVVEIKHEIAANHHRTNVKVRGTPIGQYMTWLGRGITGPGGGGGPGGIAIPPEPYIEQLNTETDELYWDLRFDAVYGSGGGGTNLTYTVKTKTNFGAEATLSTGNASAFPLDLAVLRDPKTDKLLTFTVTDAATGMSRSAQIPIPSYMPFANAAGALIGELEAPTITEGTGAIQFVAGGDDAGQLNAFLNGTDIGFAFVGPNAGINVFLVYENAATDVFMQLSVDDLRFNGQKIRFFGNTAGTTQPTVTGSRAGNAALASLLTALAAMGLIVDGSS